MNESVLGSLKEKEAGLTHEEVRKYLVGMIIGQVNIYREYHAHLGVIEPFWKWYEKLNIEAFNELKNRQEK